MDNTFVVELQNSVFYYKLFDNQDVVMIYVAGSRLCDATDDRSDYDLIVLVNGEDQDNPSEFLMYKGRKVHWYWRNVETLINAKNAYPMWCYGSVLFGYICNDCIIYKNEKYADQINFLLSHKHGIALKGAEEFYKTQERLIEEICSKLRIDEKNYTKFLGHLCVTSYYVLNEPIDKELVLKAKRIRWQPVTEEDKQKIIQRLLLLKSWIENNK